MEELFSINKVITLLKFKSAMNLQCFSLEAQSRERDRMRFRNRIRSLDCASNEKHCKFTADLNFKSVITLLVLNSSSSFFYFYASSVVSFKVHFLFRDFSIYIYDFRHYIYIYRYTVAK